MERDVNWVAEPPPTPAWLRLPLYRPRVTPLLLVVLVLVYGVVTLYGLQQGLGIDGPANSDLEFQFGAMSNRAVLDGQYWRLFTAMFLHHDPLHIALNGLGIYIFGQLIERYFGSARFVLIYLIAGLGGSVASFAFNPLNGISVGASGALFGLVGALGAYFWLHRRLTGAEGRAQLLNAVFIVVINVMFGLSLSQAIDNWAHIGGLVTGTLAGFALAPRYQPGPYLAPDERRLVDALPGWGVTAITLALAGGLVLTFALALLTKR